MRSMMGIMHLYYTYGKNYTAEFSSWFDPLGFADKCSDEAGSSEISISCHKSPSGNIHQIKFDYQKRKLIKSNQF